MLADVNFSRSIFHDNRLISYFIAVYCNFTVFIYSKYNLFSHFITFRGGNFCEFISSCRNLFNQCLFICWCPWFSKSVCNLVTVFVNLGNLQFRTCKFFTVGNVLLADVNCHWNILHYYSAIIYKLSGNLNTSKGIENKVYWFCFKIAVRGGNFCKCINTGFKFKFLRCVTRSPLFYNCISLSDSKLCTRKFWIVGNILFTDSNSMFYRCRRCYRFLFISHCYGSSIFEVFTCSCDFSVFNCEIDIFSFLVTVRSCSFCKCVISVRKLIESYRSFTWCPCDSIGFKYYASVVCSFFNLWNLFSCEVSCFGECKDCTRKLTCAVNFFLADFDSWNVILNCDNSVCYWYKFISFTSCNSAIWINCKFYFSSDCVTIRSNGFFKDISTFLDASDCKCIVVRKCW